MRAAAFDQEAALTQGVNVGSVFALSWAMAGALAAVAGTLLATAAGVDRQLWIVALVALPAIILGGLDSLRGRGHRRAGRRRRRVAGRHLPARLRARGSATTSPCVSPYVLMLLVLLVRPYGLFGTPEVRARMTTTDGPDPGATRRGRLRGRPQLYRSYAPGAGAVQHPRPSWSWVASSSLRGFARCPSCSTDSAAADPGDRRSPSRIGALGLNIVTGLAGQVSLGHAFFLGVGAYTAAAISGDPDGRTIGFGITNMLVWLPAAGLVAAVAGVLVAPLATRLRGLYLAIVTLGLVFIGEHIFGEWSDLTGGAGVGREAAVPELFGYDFSQDSDDAHRGPEALPAACWCCCSSSRWAPATSARSRIGRAFAAVRDRDIAAEMMGINLPRDQDGGVRDLVVLRRLRRRAASTSIIGFFDPSSFNLLLSVQFIAMVLIGGAARSAARSWARCSSRCCRR